MPVDKVMVIGIAGGTGSGKTTLLSLLMRFYDVNEGSVRIDGRDVRTIPEHELHSMFGVAMQNDFICADTVEENINFGRGLGHGDIVRAARIAQAEEYIEHFPEKYERMLTANGTNISGGQRQRLTIARALVGSPQILILDDSTSAVDTKTDAKIREGLASYLPNTTKLIIAQRISSVQDADRIIVMEGGRIKDIGNHDELLKTSEIYRETFTSQNKMSAEGEEAAETAATDTEASAPQAQIQEGGEAHE